MEVVSATLDYSINEIGQNSTVLTSYEESFYSSFLSKETPPPDFMS
jgi:hypothetical protein